MPLSCQPFQRGSHPRACRTRSQIKTLSNAMEKPILAVSSQRNNVGSLHTVNVIFPEKSRPSHSVTFGKGDELMSPDRSRNRSSTKINDIHPNAEVSAVPAPVPNPLIQVQSSVAEHTTPLPDSPRTVAGNASSSLFVYPASPVVSNPLSRLSSTAPSLSGTSSLSFVLSTSASAKQPLGTFNKVPSRQATPHQLPAVAIILLATGGVLFVASILFLTKLCLRPRRRSHPTPSLPILQDVFPQSKMGDESPLFGGKERLSSQPGNNAVPWTWTQYQSDMPKPAPVASILKPDAMNQAQKRYSRLVDEPQNLFHPGEPTMHGALAKPGTTNQSSDGHTKKALSRLSSLSGVVYSASMYDSTGQENIGIAVSSGQGDLESGVSAAREHRKRASARQSIRNFDKRRSTIYGSPEGLAYTMSPSMSPADNGRDDSDESSKQGRARVQAPYVAGSYLRGSGPKGPDRSFPEVDPFGDPGNGAYKLPPTPSSFMGKETKLKGGAVVVGSAAPDPSASPGFSLYPDDSLSVTEDQTWAVPKLIKGQKYTQNSQGIGEDGEDSITVADGELSGASTSPGMAPRRLSALNSRAQEQQMEILRRTDDRPPRVPSPPVLPSLAQMAMAHTNEQDYGEYRSPTYSLYGLYS
ncbi:hypothetical protein F5888DRAFT_1662390 [Russula emetica]|nr:hypothetical protein F5888DRAFT_1662390 [Russula emetica]